ncbi:MFS transporter [Providencia manganoxydans]|uniref:MFS transporter n=1 Tax=Providencia manganoxydans TaxID=2923283 RepID=UPI0034E5D426
MKWKFRLGAVAGNTLEYYDIAVFAAISVYLSAELERLGYSSATEMVWGIFALRFLARPIGGYVIGRYADRVGKKPALVFTSLLTGTATLCMAVLPIQLLGSYTPIVILILQLILSFSFGGEYPSLITYLLNNISRKECSKVSSLVVGSSIVGVIISLAIVLTLERTLTTEMMQSIGWRIPLLLGLVNIAISFWFRLKLPDQPVTEKRNHTMGGFKVLQIFLLTVPGSATFYSQNISSSILSEHLQLGEFKSIYSIVLSSLLLTFMLICGWFTDKYSSPQKIFNLGVIGMVLLSIPLYFAMSSGVMILVSIAQLVIIINGAMILCNLSAVLMVASGGQTVVLAVGYNLASAFIGGLTPLVISYLVGINVAYVGGFIALCGLTLLLSNSLSKNYQLAS